MFLLPYPAGSIPAEIISGNTHLFINLLLLNIFPQFFLFRFSSVRKTSVVSIFEFKIEDIQVISFLLRIFLFVMYPSVLVLGHSFVRRMRDYLYYFQNMDLGLAQIGHITYHGVGGHTVFDLWDEISFIDAMNPDILLLEIGSNDLSFNLTQPAVLVDELLKFVWLIKQRCSISQVAIFQVFYRSQAYKPRRKQRDFMEYNQAVYMFNDILYERLCCPSFQAMGVHYHKLKGIWNPFEVYLRSDGVHLNQNGMKKHAHHYKQAIILSASKIGIHFH